MNTDLGAIPKTCRVLRRWRDHQTPLVAYGGGLLGQFGLIVRGHLIGITSDRIFFNTGTELSFYGSELTKGDNGPRLLLEMCGHTVAVEPMTKQTMGRG